MVDSANLAVEIVHSQPRLTRPRALTAALPPSTTKPSYKPIRKSNHGRAFSELNLSYTWVVSSQISSPESLDMEISNRHQEQNSNALQPNPSLIGSSVSLNSVLPQLPLNTDDGEPYSPTLSSSESETDAMSMLSVSGRLSSAASADSTLQNGDDLEGQASSTNHLQSLLNEDTKVTETEGSGETFDELVDRLLLPPMSKSDSKFVTIFLCFYRKFAAPSDLISAVIHRFEKLSNDDVPQIMRITSQLRYLSIIAQWVSDYPGDFAHPLTRRNMSNFLAGLADTKVFALASKEMHTSLNVIVEDDDTGWACSDAKRSRCSTVESLSSVSLIPSTTSSLNVPPPTDEIISESESDVSEHPHSTWNSETLSITSSAERSGSQSTGSFQSLLHSVESAQRQAQTLVPIGRGPLTKLQWHLLMETSEEDVAQELTRIDWIMFSSIRPRDFVRHVSLVKEQRGGCKGLENVDRMINHFNHVAFWVANFILLRDKPKHRAQALERFMRIAWVSLSIRLEDHC